MEPKENQTRKQVEEVASAAQAEGRPGPRWEEFASLKDVVNALQKDTRKMHDSMMRRLEERMQSYAGVIYDEHRSALAQLVKAQVGEALSGNVSPESPKSSPSFSMTRSEASDRYSPRRQAEAPVGEEAVGNTRSKAPIPAGAADGSAHRKEQEQPVGNGVGSSPCPSELPCLAYGAMSSPCPPDKTPASDAALHDSYGGDLQRIHKELVRFANQLNRMGERLNLNEPEGSQTNTSRVSRPSTPATPMLESLSTKCCSPGVADLDDRLRHLESIVGALLSDGNEGSTFDEARLRLQKSKPADAPPVLGWLRDLQAKQQSFVLRLWELETSRTFASAGRHGGGISPEPRDTSTLATARSAELTPPRSDTASLDQSLTATQRKGSSLVARPSEARIARPSSRERMSDASRIHAPLLDGKPAAGSTATPANNSGAVLERKLLSPYPSYCGFPRESSAGQVVNSTIDGLQRMRSRSPASAVRYPTPCLRPETTSGGSAESTHHVRPVCAETTLRSADTTLRPASACLQRVEGQTMGTAFQAAGGYPTPLPPERVLPAMLGQSPLRQTASSWRNSSDGGCGSGFIAAAACPPRARSGDRTVNAPASALSRHIALQHEAQYTPHMTNASTTQTPTCIPPSGRSMTPRGSATPTPNAQQYHGRGAQIACTPVTLQQQQQQLKLQLPQQLPAQHVQPTQPAQSTQPTQQVHDDSTGSHYLLRRRSMAQAM